MSALTVLVIRHGEKPDPDHPDEPPGLTSDGVKDKHSPQFAGGSAPERGLPYSARL
jgi:hypothetical protein